MLTRTCKYTMFIPKDKIALAEYLDSMGFNYYVTVTTRYELSLKSARQLMKKFHSQLLQNCSNVTIFWVAEANQLRDGYHLHLLVRIDGVEAERAKNYIWIAAQNAAFGASRIDKANTHVKPYIKGRGAHLYVVKDLHLPHTDYDIFC